VLFSVLVLFLYLLNVWIRAGDGIKSTSGLAPASQNNALPTQQYNTSYNITITFSKAEKLQEQQNFKRWFQVQLVFI
jgi:pantothenate synthetase